MTSNLKLAGWTALNNPKRQSSLDFYRGIAIIAVLFFHFNHWLPIGYFGVDLFFIISGYLVGGMLIKMYLSEEKVRFFPFFLQRGFKIWPSYYFFLIFGTIFAYVMYSKSHPEQCIRWAESLRYIFLYQNYRGEPFHWSFDHVWSLCVEEHFYILIPIFFIVLQRINLKKEHKAKTLLVLLFGIVLSGYVLKTLSFYFTSGHDTSAGTHNRIDALSLGMIAYLITTYFRHWISSVALKRILVISGLIICAVTFFVVLQYEYIFFEKLMRHTLTPIGFTLILLGTLHMDFSKFKIIRFISYYSYNLYLWNSVLLYFINDYVGNNWIGLICFLILTFILAIGFTVLIEEPFLRLRNKLLPQRSNSLSK